MSVFDLSQLTEMSKKYRASDAFKAHASQGKNATGSVHVNLGNTLEPNSVYKEFGSSHNIVINEETGYLYAVGTKTCEGGPHIVDIRDPANPTFVGCYADDGYTHDAGLKYLAVYFPSFLPQLLQNALFTRDLIPDTQTTKFASCTMKTL